MRLSNKGERTRAEAKTTELVQTRKIVFCKQQIISLSLMVRTAFF